MSVRAIYLTMVLREGHVKKLVQKLHVTPEEDKLVHNRMGTKCFHPLV